MASSSASAFSDEIPNNNVQGSCIIDVPFSPLPSCNLFDMPPPPSLSDHQDQNDGSFAGYMDMLSSDDFNFNASWFSNFNFEIGTSESLPAATQTDVQLPPLPVLSPVATSEILNNVATPASGSSSNTSSPNEAGVVANKPVVARAENEDGREFVEGKEVEAKDHGGDRRIEVVENRNDQNQTKKPVKPKTDKKKQKLKKVIFKTQTEEDYLDDGYRWRKYGQKPVKNSPFPRSYYRCTTPGCEVKKHIERFALEPSMLLTSYEGKHTHLAPKVKHVSRLEIMHDAIAAGDQKIHRKKIKTDGVGVAGNKLPMSQSQPQQFQNQNQNVILQQPALHPLLYNNGYHNSFNVAPTSNVVNYANNSPPLNVVNSSAADNFPSLNVVNSAAAENSPPLNVINSAGYFFNSSNVVNYANNSPPLNAVNSSAADNSPTLNVVNTAAADNFPSLNVVNSAGNFFNSSTSFSEFLQNLGGCNYSLWTGNLRSNDGLLEDVIMPRETRGAWAGAGAGAVAGR
ncbi:unnamed protein product [Lathyrus sativus]|nr:unnamed protein product [Lathyrus sativus]